MPVGSREHYRVAGADVDTVVQQLNFALARIAERLDQLEGRTAQPHISENLKVYDAAGNLVGGFSTDLP